MNEDGMMRVRCINYVEPNYETRFNCSKDDSFKCEEIFSDKFDCNGGILLLPWTTFIKYKQYLVEVKDEI